MGTLYIVSKTAGELLYKAIFFLTPLLIFIIPLVIMNLLSREATKRFIPGLPRFPWEFPLNKQGGKDRISYIDPEQID
jgi:hypothetical protein